MSAKVEFAQPTDMPAILRLLADSGLPEAGLACRPGTLILTLKRDGALLGCAALQLFGEDALLRSVAVAQSHRGQGLGDRLTETALDIARRLRTDSVYLLTETAAPFFSRHGFTVTARAQVPAAVVRSEEFVDCRCAGATAMVRRLQTSRGGRASASLANAGLALSLHDLALVVSERRPAVSRCF